MSRILKLVPLAWILLLNCAWAEGPTAEAVTDLDRYVQEPDDAYAWKLVRADVDAQATTFVVDLTSQAWRKPDEVDRTIWQHWLLIVKPKQATANTAMLFIGGGRNGGEPPPSADPRVQAIALATNTVVAELRMVPNQPLIFHGDGQPRSEDDLIAYAWDQFLKTRDNRWAPRLPMVKAVVRAMDTVQALLKSEEGGKLAIEKFVVAGGSKRGWTTWMTAAVDPRVAAIAPIVIDVLNANRSMEHHYAAYGYWAPALDDYVRHKITERRRTARYAELLRLVDPYAYRARYKMPKCIINATGDEFFLPDSSRFYFDDLPGEKHLCYVPNGNHSLNGTNALDTLIAFHHAIAHDLPRPELSWKFDGEQTIRVEPKTTPKRVLLWQATNPQARDFRVDTIGKSYRSQELTADTRGHYVGTVEKPEQGWTAYFVQLEYDIQAPTPLRLSTPVRVVPDKLPFADKTAPLSE